MFHPSRPKHNFSSTRRRALWAAIALALPLGLLPPSAAHHTSRISYVYQEVGEKPSDCYSIKLAATPPKWTPGKGGKISPGALHKKMSAFSHRFLLHLRRWRDLKAIGGPGVWLTFERDDWRKTFRLRRSLVGGEPAYAANVALGPRGAYAVTARIEGAPHSGCKKIPKGGKISVNFEFENDYESLKEVMTALESALLGLAKRTLTLGLDGEFVPPRAEKRIRDQAARLKDLVQWTVNLREGAAQEIYEDRAARLLEVTEGIEAAARKADYGGIVRRLGAARAACVGCHDIFQEADATGGPPKLPLESSRRGDR